MTDETLRRAADAAMLPIVTSLAPAGVIGAHWLPDRAGDPEWRRRNREPRPSRHLARQSGNSARPDAGTGVCSLAKGDDEVHKEFLLQVLRRL